MNIALLFFNTCIGIANYFDKKIQVRANLLRCVFFQQFVQLVFHKAIQLGGVKNGEKELVFDRCKLSLAIKKIKPSIRYYLTNNPAYSTNYRNENHSKYLYLGVFTYQYFQSNQSTNHKYRKQLKTQQGQ